LEPKWVRTSGVLANGIEFAIADIYDRTGKPLNLTGLPAIAVDDVHWSKD